MPISKIALLEQEKGQSIESILQDAFAIYGTQSEVAKALGVTQSTISLWLVKLGYEVKSTIVKKSA